MTERTARPAIAKDAEKKKHQPPDFTQNSQAYFTDNRSGDFTLYRKASCACGGGCTACQAKSSDLKVSNPNDAAEIEADRIADTVMRMPRQGRVQTKQNSQSLAPTIRTKSNGGDAPVSGEIGSRIDSSRGGGRSLDGSTRGFMERRFGTDLSSVRIHTGSEAENLNQDLSARAFTLGSDIYFGAGEYQPHSTSGRRLIAHELAHVLQQGGGGANPTGPVVQRQEAPSLLLLGTPAFPGCSPYERFRMDYQLTRARTFVQVAHAGVAEELARPDRSTGIITIAGSAISRNFHTSEERHIRTLLTRLERIDERLSRPSRNWRCASVAECRRECGTSSGPPLACAEPSSPVLVCPAHFEGGDTEGALTLVHEAAHQAGLGLRPPAGHRTDIYEHEERRFAALTPPQALNAPDAYAALVRAMMLYGGPLPTSQAWTARDMQILGAIYEPQSLGVTFVGRSPELTRFPPGGAIENRFWGVFVFDAWAPGTPHRPSFLRSPEVSLRIVLRRSGAARGGRPLESVLFDRRQRAAPDEFGRMNPPGTTNGYEFDFRFDTADRGTLRVVSEIRDEDTGTTMTYDDQVSVRPTATPASGVAPTAP